MHSLSDKKSTVLISLIKPALQILFGYSDRSPELLNR
jgi:hypothetical protein